MRAACCAGAHSGNGCCRSRHAVMGSEARRTRQYVARRAAPRENRTANQTPRRQAACYMVYTGYARAATKCALCCARQVEVSRENGAPVRAQAGARCAYGARRAQEIAENGYQYRYVEGVSARNEIHAYTAMVAWQKCACVRKGARNGSTQVRSNSAKRNSRYGTAHWRSEAVARGRRWQHAAA